jgi:PHD-finger
MCVCKVSSVAGDMVVPCQVCQTEYHPKCLALSPGELTAIQSVFVCPHCSFREVAWRPDEEADLPPLGQISATGVGDGDVAMPDDVVSITCHFCRSKDVSNDDLLLVRTLVCVLGGFFSLTFLHFLFDAFISSCAQLCDGCDAAFHTFCLENPLAGAFRLFGVLFCCFLKDRLTFPSSPLSCSCR